MRRILISLTLLGLAAFAGGAGAQNATGDLPDMGNPASAKLSQADEYKIGLMILRGLRDEGRVIEDPEVVEYVQSVGQRLASQAHEGSHRFTFFVVRDPEINAFALPGGFIGLHAGLLAATRNENELAGVLAHEIAHVTQRHIARSVQNAGRTTLASAAAVLAAILVGTATGMPADAMMGSVSAAQSLAIQQQINFTRANEAEADRVGIRVLSAAGFDPLGMPDFFETLQQRTGLAAAAVPPMLQTHPVTSERIAETRDRAFAIRVGPTADSPSYALIRERVRIQSMPAETDFKALYARGQDATAPVLERYRRALVLMAGHAPGEAVALLAGLQRQHPAVTLYHTALGQALLEAGEVAASRRVLEDAVRLFPRNVPVTTRLAETLVRDGQAQRAHQLLLDLFNNVPPTPAQARYIAQVANTAGDTADAYYYMAEHYVMSGELTLAIDQLRLALAVPNLTSVQRQRFEARIEELSEYLPRGRRERQVPARSGERDAGSGGSG